MPEPDSSTLEQELLISRLTKAEKLRQVLAKIEFNDCHDGGTGQFCTDDSGMMDHATAGMASATVKRVSASPPKAGLDDLRFNPSNKFSGVVLSPNTADRQASILASSIRVNGIDNADVAPITRARADFMGVDRDSAGLVVSKGGIALAAVIGEPDGKARIVPLDTDRQDYNIIKHAALRMFAKESVNEFNDCHTAENGQFCSDTLGIGGAKSSDGSFETGKPVTFSYLHNTEKSPYLGSQFGQNIEPAGQYVIQKEPGSSKLAGWEEGKISMQNPLVVAWSSDGTKYDWKQKLSDATGGLTGKDLSKYLKGKGYDGIVTIDNGHTSEIVNLKPIKKEFNDCHLPGGDSTGGQFCSEPTGPTVAGVVQVGSLPTSGLVGGTTRGAPWVPLADNPLVRVWEPIELSDTVTASQTKAADDLFSKAVNFDNQLTPEHLAEEIRQASFTSYQAIGVTDTMSKDILAQLTAESQLQEARAKGPVSAVTKAVTKSDKYDSFRKLDDFSGMRVIAKGETAFADMRSAVATLQEKYNVTQHDDFITDGRPDGYRGIHLNVEDPITKVVAEIQLRTPNQDTWAHWSWQNLYKNENLPADFKTTIDANKSTANTYAKGMSDYYYALDSGKTATATAPDCPDFIASTVGCLPK